MTFPDAKKDASDLGISKNIDLQVQEKRRRGETISQASPVMRGVPRRNATGGVYARRTITQACRWTTVTQQGQAVFSCCSIDGVERWRVTAVLPAYPVRGLFAGPSKRIDLKLVGRLEFGSGAVAMRQQPPESPLMNMIEIIVTVCTLAQPSHCEEKHLQYAFDGLLRQCTMNAQSYLARWINEHPKWSIVRWHCEVPHLREKADARRAARQA